MRVQEFFAYARERHSVYIRRSSGLPPPWTQDRILLEHRFTNIFRELDRTTIWTRDNVREPLAVFESVLLAVVTFRWFNRIETGIPMFLQTVMLDDPDRVNWIETPFQIFSRTGSTSAMKLAILNASPIGPWVTGSYMIRSPNGLNKLDGMLHLCSRFYHESGWRRRASYMLDNPGRVTMEGFTKWLQSLDGMGPFLAYEVTCDLRYTPLLNKAPDIMTWANVGPGALRGLGRLHSRQHPNPRKAKHRHAAPVSEVQAVMEMQTLLEYSRDPNLWPPEWGAWEMREVEHTLCEFDKYERVRLGEGTPRQRFRGGTGS